MRIKSLLAKITVIAAFIATVFVNYRSVFAPIDGNSPQIISDFYLNLFAPAGLTFSIWSLIYVLLAAFCIFQLVFSEKRSTPELCSAVAKSRILFIISCMANIAWIYCWQLKAIPLSVLLMLVLLASLAAITGLFVGLPMKWHEKILLRLPFSIYFGWITIATIANATVLLVYLNWDGFGIAADLWTAIALAVGTLIGGITILARKDAAYGLVLVWAYAGILLKHTTANGFAGAYPLAITTAGICGGLLLVICMVQLLRSLSKPALDKAQATAAKDE